MGIEDNKQVVQAFFDAGDRGDVAGVLALIDDDVTWINTGSMRFSGRYEGKNTFIAELLGPLFGELKNGIASTIDQVTAEADRVVVQSRGRAETIDGRPYCNTYCHVFTIRDGRIVEVMEYMDTALAESVFGR